MSNPAVADYQNHAAERLAAQRANLRVRLNHASKIQNPKRREIMLEKLRAEFEKLGAVKA